MTRVRARKYFRLSLRSRGRCGPAGVAPFAVECVGRDLGCDGCHVGVGDWDAAGVASGVGFGVDGQAGAGSCCAYELDDSFFFASMLMTGSPVFR